jgi:adenosyl cobinamide kinase/adenosyl cobinamide phosphate guanylyltransferase
MDFLLIGGYDNGVLERAEQIAKVSGDVLDVPLCYISARSDIPEIDADRTRHRIEKYGALGFSTVTQTSDLADLLDSVDERSIFIVDSVTALLWNEMFGSGEFDVLATGRLMDGLEKFRVGVRSVLFVTHDIFCGTGHRGSDRGGDSMEYFRKGLAEIQKNLARSCNHVEEISYGFRYRFK